MRSQKKDKYIHIRIDSDVKDSFIKKCDDKSISPSKLIRKLIIDFINNG